MKETVFSMLVEAKVAASKAVTIMGQAMGQAVHANAQMWVKNARMIVDSLKKNDDNNHCILGVPF